MTHPFALYQRTCVHGKLSHTLIFFFQHFNMFYGEAGSNWINEHRKVSLPLLAKRTKSGYRWVLIQLVSRLKSSQWRKRKIRKIYRDSSWS
jgi:hypothetical protein